MTKRVTVSLPDDVAAYLEGEDNASAAVADALRARMRRGAAVAAMMRAVGIHLTDEGIAQARGKLPRRTDEQHAASRQRLAEIQAGTWPATTA
jgi:hypothetical protein